MAAKGGANGASAYAMLNMSEQQNELNRQRAVVNEQMQRLKQAMFEQLEQVHIKSALQNKDEEYAALIQELSERDEERRKLVAYRTWVCADVQNLGMSGVAVSAQIRTWTVCAQASPRRRAF